MKHFTLLRFVPKPLRLTRLLHRTPAIPPQRIEGPPKHEQFGYAPLWIGGVALPYIVETRDARRKRDPYD